MSGFTVVEEGNRRKGDMGAEEEGQCALGKKREIVCSELPKTTPLEKR